MIRRDKYQVGDTVWFKEPEQFMINKYGTGPHKVTKIIPVTEGYRGVSHTQWIEIEKGGKYNQFSGYWFHPLRKPE